MSFAVSAAVVGGGLSYLGSKKAGDAQAKAGDAAIAEQQRQYDLYREDQAPYRQIGAGALNQLAGLYGIPQYDQHAQGAMGYQEWAAAEQAAGRPSDQDTYNQYVSSRQPQQGAAPDYSAFYNSPDYKFALDQGNQGLQRAAAAGGNLASGNTLAAAQQYGQGLASQQYGNYVNRLAGLAGIGQNATNATGQAGITTGQGVADSLVGSGAARASGIAGQYNAFGDIAGALGSAGNQWWNNRQGAQPVRPGFTGPR